MQSPSSPSGAISGIDVHAHVVPLDFPPRLAGSANTLWPSVHKGCGCHATVFMGESKYREIDERCWHTAARTPHMDAARVRMQALSPMPELLSYWFTPEDGAYLCRFLNEQIARMVAGEPARFAGLGAVPLQDVDLAIRELEHLMGALGLQGVEIGSNINGVAIGDARFLPFFKAAERLGAAVFVHPLRPAGVERLVGPPILEQILAFPAEIGQAGASMITGGNLAACPDLRLCLSHGGGMLAHVLPRLEAAWRMLPAVTSHMADSPTLLARRMFYDLCVFDADFARALVRSFGDGQVVIGTDAPFALSEQAPLALIESLGLPADAAAKLAWRNALRLLNLPEARVAA